MGARRDVVPCDAGVISPFAAIVADHHLRLAALDHQPVQFPRHPGAGERGVGHQRQALARAIIDHGKDAEATAIGELSRPRTGIISNSRLSQSMVTS